MSVNCTHRPNTYIDSGFSTLKLPASALKDGLSQTLQSGSQSELARVPTK